MIATGCTLSAMGNSLGGDFARQHLEILGKAARRGERVASPLEGPRRALPLFWLHAALAQ